MSLTDTQEPLTQILRRQAGRGNRVTVLLPVGRVDEFTAEAIRSVALPDVELHILLDGVTEDAIVRMTQDVDGSLTLWGSERRRGVARILNSGIANVATPYLARMDGDDISYPNRFALQKSFLDAHSQVAVVGSWAQHVDESGNPIRLYQTPVRARAIKTRLLLKNCMIHPSIMARTEIIQNAGGYRQDLERAEDYELWMRLACTHELANIPQPLLRYRIHSRQVTTSSGRTHHPNDARVLHQTRRQLARSLGLPAAAADISTRLVDMIHSRRK